MSVTPALEVEGIGKSFPGTRALDGVSLRFEHGEVHGIVGENGAGKSTLMRILAGVLRPDEGRVRVGGRDSLFHGVRDALNAGIAMIHQELNLVGELSVAENIFLGREPTLLGTGRRIGAGLVNRRAMERESTALLAQVGSTLDPRATVSSLSVAQQQLVEIAKALSCQARVLILDEPTAVLSERETSSLFTLIRSLSARGVTVIYISHLLPEVLSLCGRISVLRDGRLVTTVAAGEVDESKLASLMVGRPFTDVFPPRVPRAGASAADGAAPGPPAALPAALEVHGLSCGTLVRDISFSMAPGEILGLAGLVGSGRTECAEAIVGLRRLTGGAVQLFGRQVRFRNPRQALAAGVAYVSEDRKGRGVHLDMSCMENITLANLRAYGRVIPRRGRERAAAARWVSRLSIRSASTTSPLRTLSGGNQQKISLAKWLDASPRVLLLDEPTRGVDLGAKREIYALIASLAAQGLACVMISSELPELLGLCHRIVVLREGHVAGTLKAAAASEDEIMHLAAGVTRAGSAG